MRGLNPTNFGSTPNQLSPCYPGGGWIPTPSRTLALCTVCIQLKTQTTKSASVFQKWWVTELLHMLTLLLHSKCANFAVYKLQHCWLWVSYCGMNANFLLLSEKHKYRSFSVIRLWSGPWIFQLPVIFLIIQTLVNRLTCATVSKWLIAVATARSDWFSDDGHSAIACLISTGMHIFVVTW